MQCTCLLDSLRVGDAADMGRPPVAGDWYGLLPGPVGGRALPGRPVLLGPAGLLPGPVQNMQPMTM